MQPNVHCKACWTSPSNISSPASCHSAFFTLLSCHCRTSGAMVCLIFWVLHMGHFSFGDTFYPFHPLGFILFLGRLPAIRAGFIKYCLMFTFFIAPIMVYIDELLNDNLQRDLHNKHCRLGGLNHRSFSLTWAVSLRSGCQYSQVLVRALCLGFRWQPSLCMLTWLFCSVCGVCVCVCVCACAYERETEREIDWSIQIEQDLSLLSFKAEDPIELGSYPFDLM